MFLKGIKQLTFPLHSFTFLKEIGFSGGLNWSVIVLITTASKHLPFERLFGGLSSGIVIINIFASQKLTTLGNYNTNIHSFYGKKLWKLLNTANHFLEGSHQ